MSRKTAHNKGEIKDNAVKALVRSNLLRAQTHRKLKGKGSYHRASAKKWQRDGSHDTVSFFVFIFPSRGEVAAAG